jgi:hypothetical protein
MDEVAAVRRAALDAVDDVEPSGLRERIRDHLDDGSLAPGVLAVSSARAVRESREGPAGEFALEAVAERGAGVQLIYAGLRLTRSLAQDPPWEHARSLTDGAGRPADAGDAADAVDATGHPEDVAGPDAETDLTEADMSILVADILVARGFYLLARTEAASDAVATVQSFGRDQTTRRTTGDDSLDRNLEADVFELGAVAGAAAVGVSASAGLREHVAGLARSEESLPLAETLVTDGVVRDLAAHVDGDEHGSDVARSVDY